MLSDLKISEIQHKNYILLKFPVWEVFLESKDYMISLVAEDFSLVPHI